MPIDYLARLDSNRESGPEFAATAKGRITGSKESKKGRRLDFGYRRKTKKKAHKKGRGLTYHRRRASLRESTTSTGKGRSGAKSSRKAPMAKKKGRKKARTAAQQRATRKMIRAAKAARRSKHRASETPRKKRRSKGKRRAKHNPTPKRKRSKAKRKAAKRRRKSRKSSASEWRGAPRRHAKAAKKGWARRRRAGKAPKRKSRGRRKSGGGKRKASRKQIAAARRNIKKAHAARRGRMASQGFRSRSSRREDYAAERRRGRRRGRSRRNPSQYGLTGGELFVASIFGTLGFLGGDALDRFIATHALTDKGTKDANGNELYADNPPTSGSYSGLFNPTAICAPMDLGRWAAGIGVPAVMFVTASFVKAPMVRASMQFAAFGWGVRVVGKGAIDAIATLTKGMGTGQRLYDGEMRAAVLKANNGNQQAADLASLPSAGLGRPQLGKPLGDCAPCEQKNLGYPSMPRETSQNAQTQAPTPQMTAPPPPPPPPPAAPPPSLNMQNLTGVPKNGGRNRFNWGFNDE